MSRVHPFISIPPGRYSTECQACAVPVLRNYPIPWAPITLWQGTLGRLVGMPPPSPPLSSPQAAKCPILGGARSPANLLPPPPAQNLPMGQDPHSSSRDHGPRDASRRKPACLAHPGCKLVPSHDVPVLFAPAVGNVSVVCPWGRVPSVSVAGGARQPFLPTDEACDRSWQKKTPEALWRVIAGGLQLRPGFWLRPAHAGPSHSTYSYL